MTEQPKSGRAIVLHADDNVATALEDLPKGTVVRLPGWEGGVTLAEEIKFGHKFALADLAQGELVIKYGVAIGKLTQDVKIGQHVHLHNLVTLQWKENDA